MKKWTALFLSAILFFTNVPVLLAEDTIPDGDYIPLSLAAIGAGGEIAQGEAGEVILRHGGHTYQFKAGATAAVKDGLDYQLNMPPVNRESGVYLSYGDLAFLYETPNDPYANAKKNIVTMTFEYMELFSVPGLTLALVDNETGYTWTQGFGYADMEQGLPVTEDTVFAVGSVSKTFTALSIMQLVEKGELDLDQPILTYLPDFKLRPHPVYGGNYEDITLRMLLSHYSGIPGDNMGAFYSTDSYYKDYMNNFLDNIRDQYMDDTTLHRWSYANNGYNLLGYLLAKMTSEKGAFDGFVEYTEKNIFTPLKMEQTSFSPADKGPLAKPYASILGGRTEDYYINCLPAGGLYSNAKEMSHFISAILSGGSYEGSQIISPDTIKTMMTPVSYEDPFNPGFKMGLGFYYTPYNGFSMVGHGGNVGSYHSALQFSPENQLGIFVSTNSISAAPMVASYALLTLREAVGEKTGVTFTDLYPKEPSPMAAPPENMADLAGYYTGLGKISVVENQLYIETYDVLLTPQQNGSYHNDVFGYVWFREMGGELCVLLGDVSPEPIGQRVNVTPADKDFGAWIGEYIDSTSAPGNAPLIAKVTFLVTLDGFPAVSFTTNDGQNTGAMLLEKIDANTYYVAGTGRNLGKVITRDTLSPVNKINYYGTDFVRW